MFKLFAFFYALVLSLRPDDDSEPAIDVVGLVREGLSSWQDEELLALHVSAEAFIQEIEREQERRVPPPS